MMILWSKGTSEYLRTLGAVKLHFFGNPFCIVYIVVLWVAVSSSSDKVWHGGHYIVAHPELIKLLI